MTVDKNSDRRQAHDALASLRLQNKTVRAGLELVLLEPASEEHVVEATVPGDPEPAGDAAASPGTKD